MRSARLWFMVALLFAVGCNRQDTEALTRICKKLTARAETLTGEMKTGAATSWSGAPDTGVEARVASRLRWDQQLDGLTLEVRTVGSAIELHGKVRNLEQHRRAVMLAESTLGVEAVRDALVESDR